jgi:2-polyprenyl-6-methoxyphenol hydroxylase-like FAD-dependent oxidoreductase
MKRILISGAGIAGPAMAWWLHRQGFQSVVVERAPQLRQGGQAVDFRGPVHRSVLDRMGLWDAIHQRRTPSQALDVLNASGRSFTVLPEYVFCGDVEITRGDLSALLYERTRAFTDYRFGEQLTALRDVGDGVEVELEKGGSERFDLVIGADGLHSRVRALCWGDESALLRHQGYRIASFDMGTELVGEHGILWSRPGLGLTLSRTRTGGRASMFFRGAPLPVRAASSELRAEVHRAFANAGWETARFLVAMDAAPDVYLDAITLVEPGSYAKGRVVLLGDAAWGGTLGGQGTPLAIIGACVLAANLAQHPNDAATALTAYEKHMRPYAMEGQNGARHVGGFHAPRNALALAVRNGWMWAFTHWPLAGLFRKLVTRRADGFLLPATAP